MPTIAEKAKVSKPAAIWLARLLGVLVTLGLRTGNPLCTDMLVRFYLGLMVLGGLWLRDSALRVLISLRHRFILPIIHPYGASHV